MKFGDVLFEGHAGELEVLIISKSSFKSHEAVVIRRNGELFTAIPPALERTIWSGMRETPGYDRSNGDQVACYFFQTHAVGDEERRRVAEDMGERLVALLSHPSNQAA